VPYKYVYMSQEGIKTRKQPKTKLWRLEWKQERNMQNDERTPKYVAYVENILQEMKTTERKQILKVDVKQTRLRRAKSESGTLSKCFPIKLTFQI